jgi:hypothetical protein
MTPAVNAKAFALTAAALLVLVGFSAAVAEPLAVNPPGATMVLPFQALVGRWP